MKLVLRALKPILLCARCSAEEKRFNLVYAVQLCLARWVHLQSKDKVLVRKLKSYS